MSPFITRPVSFNNVPPRNGACTRYRHAKMGLGADCTGRQQHYLKDVCRWNSKDVCRWLSKVPSWSARFVRRMAYMASARHHPARWASSAFTVGAVDSAAARSPTYLLTSAYKCYMASAWLRHQSASSANAAFCAGASHSAAARSKYMAASSSSVAERGPTSQASDSPLSTSARTPGGGPPARLRLPPPRLRRAPPSHPPQPRAAPSAGSSPSHRCPPTTLPPARVSPSRA